jgi:biofilm PGA synthesis N-glycosyltransferase PgaC
MTYRSPPQDTAEDPPMTTSPEPRAPDPRAPDPRAYVIVSPGRNEAKFMRRTLDSVIAQTHRPALWVIVDDGSTDESPEILADYAARHDWIRVIRREDRGHRAVGSGVIDAFYAGWETVDPARYAYLCKLDLDLDLPEGYFEGLIEKMEADPRLGTCSGKAYYIDGAGNRVWERMGDEMSVGASKFYRRACFEDIGGFVREVMWDGLDCHMVRWKGWRAQSFPGEALAFEHLRPMGSSQQNILVGRRRHGAGQWFMGSDPIYFTATALWKMAHPPYITGGLATLQGFIGAWLAGAKQYDDPELRAFIRRYQRRALLGGKARAVTLAEAEREGMLAG